ncbi:MAG: adenylate/guanylate cyclase domain-containing protein [Anaerolineales bacterium]|nr:adenylate/guanylate cyclase domain-containing protein [Anaerolineales bacterium]
MSELPEQDAEVESLWRTYLTEGEIEHERRQRRFFRLLPGDRRCKNCYAPFDGAGSYVVRALYGKEPSTLNPRLCNICEKFARRHQGGVDIELSLMFADVRGSTEIAEKMSPNEFGQLINRFYDTATKIMVRSDALIDKIIGDQVAGIFVPGFVGPNHAAQAIEAGEEILRATGHGRPEGPWIPLGAGVHTGVAFVGSVVSQEGSSDITVLGDVPNTTARLASSAGVGEILISEASYEEADLPSLKSRNLQLKGKSSGIRAFVLPVVAESDKREGLEQP